MRRERFDRGFERAGVVADGLDDEVGTSVVAEPRAQAAASSWTTSSTPKAAAQSLRSTRSTPVTCAAPRAFAAWLKSRPIGP